MQFTVEEIRKACDAVQLPREHAEALNLALVYLAGYSAGKAGDEIAIPRPPPPARKKPGRKPKPVAQLNPVAPPVAPPAEDVGGVATGSRWKDGAHVNGAAT